MNAATELAEDKTKDELLEEARALDIQGRSEMTKDELAEAVAEATASTREASGGIPVPRLSSTRIVRYPDRLKLRRKRLARA